MLLLLENTHILSKFLELPNNNVVQALELCDVTKMDLNCMKTKYAEIVKNTNKICEEENMDVNIRSNANNANSKKMGRNNEGIMIIDQLKLNFEKMIDV